MNTREICPWCDSKNIELWRTWDNGTQTWNCLSCNSYIEEDEFDDN